MLTRAWSPTVAATVALIVLVAQAPLNPRAAALMLLARLLSVATCSARIATLCTSISLRLPMSLPSIHARVVVRLTTSALAAAPEIRPPLPELAPAKSSSRPRASTLSEPPVTVTPLPTRASVDVVAVAEDAFDPSASRSDTLMPDTVADCFESVAARTCVPAEGSDNV